MSGDASAAACGEDVSAETSFSTATAAGAGGGHRPDRAGKHRPRPGALAENALVVEAKARPDAARRAKRRLTALVDPLSGWARLADGELLPPTIAPPLPEELRADLRPLIAADLTRFDLGRTTRVVSNALRTLLGQLDGECCRFPGCTRTRKLHAHHVVFWSDGGPTDLSNLVHHKCIPRHPRASPRQTFASARSRVTTSASSASRRS